jgi:hypothetical protein
MPADANPSGRQGAAAARRASTRPDPRVQGLLGVTLLAPLVAFVGAGGIQIGLWDWRVGYDLLAQKVGWGLCLLGIVAAIAALILARRSLRRSGLVALLAVAVALLTFAGFWMSRSQAVGSDSRSDVTTNIADPPGFGAILLAQRADAGSFVPRRIAGQADGCENPGSVPTQIAPETATEALRKAGFTPLGRGVARADGTYETFWFSFGYDAAIRIRPGQTDVRVVSRQDRDDGGLACRLLNRIVVGITPSTTGSGDTGAVPPKT